METLVFKNHCLWCMRLMATMQMMDRKENQNQSLVAMWPKGETKKKYACFRDEYLSLSCLKMALFYTLCQYSEVGNITSKFPGRSCCQV